MMLLERDPVLASLRQYAHEAGQGEGRLVLIAGEAGLEMAALMGGAYRTVRAGRALHRPGRRGDCKRPNANRGRPRRAGTGLARQKLRQIGARSVPAGPRRATRAHPLGLTPRECEVLELICEGQANAQIARTLFISAKTVHHHVSAVLAKLGVENRESAADMSRNLTA
jgi:DNA-binding CsgD family transcriptional regulator